MADPEKDPPWISHRTDDGTPVAKPRPIDPDNCRMIDSRRLRRIGYVRKAALAALELGAASRISVDGTSLPEEDHVAVYVAAEEADDGSE